MPRGDAHLSGMLAGLTLRTTAAVVYRALLEALCFGARRIVELLEGGGAPVERVILTSGLSLRSPLLMQLMADILGRDVHVPQREHLTAVGVVRDFTEGARRFGETQHRVYRPDASASEAYRTLYSVYRALGHDPSNRDALHRLAALKR